MPAAHRQPERVHRAVRAVASRGAVGEPHAASLRHGLGGAGKVRVGLAAERRRPQARQDPRSAPESSLRTASSAETSPAERTATNSAESSSGVKAISGR